MENSGTNTNQHTPGYPVVTPPTVAHFTCKLVEKLTRSVAHQCDIRMEKLAFSPEFVHRYVSSVAHLGVGAHIVESDHEAFYIKCQVYARPIRSIEIGPQKIVITRIYPSVYQIQVDTLIVWYIKIRDCIQLLGGRWI